MVESFGEIGDNWVKISEGRNSEEFQNHAINLMSSDVGLKIIKHSQVCSVCRNLQIMIGDIIIQHINEFEKIEIK